MYLFVSTFLLLAVTGLFTELFVAQSARFWNHQKAVAEVMTTWHLGAYNMAKEMSASVTPTCSVSPYSPSGIGLCGVVLVAPVGASYCTGCNHHYLPLGYTFSSELQFPSVVYTDGANRYLLTYVPKESAGGAAWLGFTSQDIHKQFGNANTPMVSVVETATSCNGTAGSFFATAPLQVSDVSYRQVCYPILSSPNLGQVVGLISIL